ncbi:hypothetical protein ACJ41O_001133 [Fusarium nematophilum]
MSGFELVALFPIIRGAFATYQVLEPRLKTMIDYTGVLEQTRSDLNLSRTLFDMEFHRLLRFAFTDGTIRQLKSDPDRKQWKNGDGYDRRLRRGLGDRYETCMDLVGKIGRELQQLSETVNKCVKKQKNGIMLCFTVTRVAPELEEITRRLRRFLEDLGSLLTSMEALAAGRSLGSVLRPMYVFAAELFANAKNCVGIGKGAIDDGAEK